MPIEAAREVWMDGVFVPWDEATVHVLTPTLHYGWGVFEGIRAYATPQGPAVLCHREHYERLHRSAAMLQLTVPYSVDELVDATRELIARSGLSSCYIRPLVYLGYGEMGLNPLPSASRVSIAAWAWGTYLGEDGLRDGVHAKTSTWTRIGANMIPTGTKACGVYINSSLAKVEALQAGYDEAILLNEHGEVAEGSGENIFIVRDGTLITPPVSAGVLRGITREVILRFAADLDLPVAEERLLRQDLYVADEAFFTGTAAEVVPIRAVDHREIGPPGPRTKQLQDLYFSVVRGEEPAYADLMDVIAV